MPTLNSTPKQIAQRRLAILWLIWGSGLFLLVTIQSLLGKFGEDPTLAWEWLLPTLTPTLALILSVVLNGKYGQAKSDTGINTFVYQVTLGLSVFYLFLATLTLLMQPFFPGSPAVLMKRSHLWLGPMQGFVTAGMGMLFLGAKDKEKKS